MNEKEVTNIPGLPESEVVVIKKLGFGSLNNLRSKSTTASMSQTSDVKASVDLGNYMKWMVVYGVKSASFFEGLTFDQRAKYIDNDKLPSETGEFLYAEIKKLNNFEGADELRKKSD